MSKIVSVNLVRKDNGFYLSVEKKLASGKKQTDFLKEKGKACFFDDEVQALSKKQILLNEEKTNLGKKKSKLSLTNKNKT